MILSINKYIRTSFEGYRKGDPRYLTLESESNLLEDYNVKDFL